MIQQPHESYVAKFSEFIDLCQQIVKLGGDHVAIANPSVLGDTYEEVIESLSRLADANLDLRIDSR